MSLPLRGGPAVESTTPPRLPAHLQPNREIHIIISVLSGSHGAEQYWTSKVKPMLDTHEIKYSTHRTTSTQSIIDLCRDHFIHAATKGSKQTIILLAGDGGVVDIVNTISGILMRDTYDVRPGTIFVRPVVVLFPMGTANALAWSAGIAQDPVKTMMEGRSKPLPSFEAKFSPGSKLVADEGKERHDIPLSHDRDAAVLYGAVVASWGLHASLVHMSDTAEYRKHGVERFKMAAGELMKEAHVYQGDVKIRRTRGEGWEDLDYGLQDAWGRKVQGSQGQHNYVLATLVSNLEEKFCISPESKLLDGKMRLVAIKPEGPQEVMRLLGLAYQGGKHVVEDTVLYEEIESFKIEFREDDEQWRMVCIDGKIVAVGEGGWVEIRMLPAVGMDGRRVVELVC